MVPEYDYLFLDGTFYKDGELPGRSMSEVPHPFVHESIELFKSLSVTEKQKIFFIHFNHFTAGDGTNYNSKKVMLCAVVVEGK